MREVIDMCFALFSWFAWEKLLAGIAKTATGKAYNVCKTLGGLKLDCVQILGHEFSFQNRHFLVSGRDK